MHIYLHLYTYINIMESIINYIFYSFLQLSALFSYMSKNYVSICIYMLNKFKEILVYAFVLKKRCSCIFEKKRIY